MANGSKQARKFKARLEKDNRALGWTVAHVPFAPTDLWPQMVRLRVEGRINGFAFRTSLFPATDRPGRYFLLVNRAMQRRADAAPGDTAEFTLQPDLAPRPAELPDELAMLLDEAEGLRAFYDGLNEYMRREIGKWICGVKGDASRLKRAEQMAERLLNVMEAEIELPPLIATAFRLRPRAEAGWAKLTPAQRRSELMAVFHYQTPEAREKRLAKMCAMAEAKAAKGTASQAKWPDTGVPHHPQ